MSSARGLTAIVLVTLMLAHTGEAIKCYSCSSNNDPACKEDRFDKSQHPLKDCDIDRYGHPNMEAYCKKAVHSADQNRQQLETQRSCAWASPEDVARICRESTSGFNQLVHCSTCSKDGCNGATGSALPSVLLCLLPAIAVAVFCKAA